MRITEALRVLRGDASQQSWAYRMGRTQAWWSRVENGKREPSLSDIEQLSSEHGLALCNGQWSVAGKDQA